MSWLRSLASGLRTLFQKQQVDGELDEEVSGFMEMAANEKVKQGMERKDALREVRVERGSLDVTKEVVGASAVDDVRRGPKRVLVRVAHEVPEDLLGSDDLLGWECGEQVFCMSGNSDRVSLRRLVPRFEPWSFVLAI